MPASLICFPMHRDVGRARHVAAIWLGRKTARSRDTYWQKTIDRMAGTLQRIGLPEPEVDKQLEAFRMAVQAEIDAFLGSHQDGGAA